MSGVSRLVLIGVALTAWGLFMLIFLWVLAEGSSGRSPFVDDLGNVFLAICDLVLIGTGAGVLVSAVTARTDIEKGVRVLKQVHHILAVFAPLVFVTAAWTVYLRGDITRTVATAVVMSIMILLWLMILGKARELCERFLRA